MRHSCFGFAVGLVSAAGLMTVIACGNGANDVAACRQLEDARCVRAQSCGIDLAYPLHSGSSPEDNIAACQLFYQDACLHGLTTWNPVTSKEVTSCLKAIQTDPDCNTVVNPQTNAACAWLYPPDAGTDSGTDSTASDATTKDVTVVVTVEASTDSGTDSALAACYANCFSECVGNGACQDSCEEGCQSN
jgi:hypothetical protein